MKKIFHFLIFTSVIILAGDSASGTQIKALTPAHSVTRVMFLRESVEEGGEITRSKKGDTIVYEDKPSGARFTINKQTGKATSITAPNSPTQSAKFLAICFEHCAESPRRAPTPPTTTSISPRLPASSFSLTASTSPSLSSRHATTTMGTFIPDELPETFELIKATVLVTNLKPKEQVAQIQSSAVTSQSSSSQTSQSAS